VLSCARAALPGVGGKLPVQDLPRTPVDWQRAASIACQNRIGPLVYATLRRLPQPSDRRPALEVLKSAYVVTAARNGVLFRVLQSVLEALSMERMPVIVLKGAALADTVYHERALRPMADIDLLVQEEDLEEAERRLRSVGYEIAHDPQTKKELRTRHHHWVFRSAHRGADDMPIELHWNLDPPGRPAAWDVRAIFERAESASIAGADALVLCPEDLLLHLCLHLCRHRFNGGVIALCDITASVSHYGGRLDWARLQTLAEETGASEYAFVPLRLAADLVGAGVPESVLAGLRRSGVERTLELARERILEEKGDVRGASELRLRRRRRSFGGRWAAVRRSLSPQSTASGGHAEIEPTEPRSSHLAHLTQLLRRYGPWLWALARHPRLVSAVVEREERKSELDSWCSAGMPRSDSP
jgi:hypothetical protein